MTDEGLETIRKMWHDFRRVELYRGDPDSEAKLKDELVTYIPALLAEVERLRAENAQQSEWIAALMDEQPHYATANARLTTENVALREIVQAVARIQESGTGYGMSDALPYDAQISALTIMKARALLASEETD